MVWLEPCVIVVDGVSLMRCADSYVVTVVVLRRCGIEYVGDCESDEDKFATESSTTEARSLKPAES